MMEAKKLKVGIAGFGVVGKKRKLCADLNPHLEVVAVCDKNFFKSGVTPDNVKGFTNYEELLREDLDVLFVCMTNEIAPTVVMAALRRGIHVFCEKPPGREVADLLEVMEVEKEANDKFDEASKLDDDKRRTSILRQHHCLILLG